MKGLNKTQGWPETDYDTVMNFVYKRIARSYLEDADLNELFGLQSIRESMVIWRNSDGEIRALFFVDDYQNFCFDLDEREDMDAFLAESIPMALEQSARRFGERGLDLCERSDSPRLEMIRKAGFQEIDLRTFKYCLETANWKNRADIPAGFRVRSVRGEEEVPDLVALHEAVLGPNEIDEEYRLAMMRVPGYDKSKDLLLETEDGKLVGYCICFTEEDHGELVGYTDPIGLIPDLHGRGMGKVITSAGVELLKQRGIKRIKLGTSSENLPMQKLAESVGFKKVEEKIWFHLDG